MPRPGFITGLESEAACLAALFDAAHIRVCGARPDAAEHAARSLVEAGCDVLVSFGLAGALVASLSPGAVIVATLVVAPGGRSYPTDPALSSAVRARLPETRALPIAGSDTIVGATGDKIRLNQATGGAAVEMESHRIARVAQARGLPFIAVRAVADRLESVIPRAVFDGVDERGRPRVRAIVSALARRPWDIIALASLAAHSRAAHRSLRHVAPLLRGGLLG